MSHHASSESTDVAAYRPEVVRRLLERGVSAQTLAIVLPDWHEVISSAQPLQSGSPT